MIFNNVAPTFLSLGFKDWKILSLTFKSLKSEDMLYKVLVRKNFNDK